MQNKTVLVTRPSDQAEPLCRLINEAGGHAIRFPVIQICPLLDAGTRAVATQQLSASDIVIFISTNAVRFGIKLIQSNVLSPSKQVIAIGRATASALRQAGVSVDMIPGDHFSSEALLDMLPVQNVMGKKIILFKGEGGRELLIDALTERGAEVYDLPVYRRELPGTINDTVLPLWSRGGIDGVIITSREGLDNLFTLMGDKGRNYIQQTPMVVMSERIRQACGEYQIQAPVQVAPQASDQGILTALLTLFSEDNTE